MFQDGLRVDLSGGGGGDTIQRARGAESDWRLAYGGGRERKMVGGGLFFSSFVLSGGGHKERGRGRERGGEDGDTEDGRRRTKGATAPGGKFHWMSRSERVWTGRHEDGRGRWAVGWRRWEKKVEERETGIKTTDEQVGGINGLVG